MNHSTAHAEPPPPVDDPGAGAGETPARDDAAADVVLPRGWGDAHRARERELLEVLARTDAGSPEHQRARDDLVTLHIPLVQYLARRFRDRGEPIEDLTQVGMIGLLKAVDRFELERGVELATYATPTVIGEIKRHFRDKGWAIRVPRRLQELRMSLGQATSELSQRTGRSPTVAELATHLGISEEEVLEGLEGAQAYSYTSLDAHVGSSEDSGSLADLMGADDPAMETIEYRESLRPLLAQLPARERRILVLRFFHGMTQTQISEEVGISQMHVSRLLTKSLGVLREGLLED